MTFETIPFSYVVVKAEANLPSNFIQTTSIRLSKFIPQYTNQKLCFWGTHNFQMPSV